MDDNPVIAYFDGICEPNPDGYACGGWVVEEHDALAGEVIEGHACFGRGRGWTNNIAEYEAALRVLEALWRAGYRGPVLLRGDSQLVVNQFNGRIEFACNAPLLVPLLDRLRKAGECFAGLTLQWVGRDNNRSADALSRLAYKDATVREPPVRTRVSRRTKR